MEDKTSIPNKVLKQILECSPDGYYLFYVDKDGEPEYISSVRNSILSRAFVSFLEENLEKKNFDTRRKSEEFDLNLGLSGLEEHTGGGFLLVFKNSKKDEDIDYIFNADNPAMKRGILSFTNDIVSGLRFVEKHEYAGHFIGEIEGLEDDEDDDD